jgi:hypothetical protein
VRTFSLSQGGPFQALMSRLGLVTLSGARRAVVLALFGWLPIALGEGIRVAANMSPDPTIFDISVHARLLAALPAAILSERLVEAACRSAIASLYRGRFCEEAPLDRIVDRAQELCDAWWPEAILLALAIVSGQLALWRVSGATGFVHGGTAAGPWSFPRLWYCLVALPLVQVVLLRWLWRWSIWTWVLVCVARRPLSLLATHPDRSAGLTCMSRPLTAFAGFAFAMGAELAGAWGTLILAHQTSVKAQLPELLMFLVVAAAVPLAPLLLFSGHLYWARRRGLVEYGDFATQYTRGFHVRWLRPTVDGADALGTPDLQSLADLGNSFSVVQGTRLFAFGMRPIITIWIAAALPMLPLVASIVSVEHLLKRIAEAMIGGLPL